MCYVWPSSRLLVSSFPLVLACLAFLLLVPSIVDPTRGGTVRPTFLLTAQASPNAFQKPLFPALNYNVKRKFHLQAEIIDLFDHGYDSYMRHAFPMDELLPLTCTGTNHFGGYLLTLVDSLDTLVLLGRTDEFWRQVEVLSRDLRFDETCDPRRSHRYVSVFETTIRLLGSLLASHALALELLEVGNHSSGSVPTMTGDRGSLFVYEAQLLDRAVDLADRLLPAFDTPTGIPLNEIDLCRGVDLTKGHVTCPAAAGTLLLEFGALSAYTGNCTYLTVAKRALDGLWKFRSPQNLVGTMIDVWTGRWIVPEAHIGASIDSFYEYLVKGYILFAEDDLDDRWIAAYRAIHKYTYHKGWFLSSSAASAGGVFGSRADYKFNSLQAFWPGLQVLAGDVTGALDSYGKMWCLVRDLGFLPEFVHLESYLQKDPMRSRTVGPGYPLRPEFIESTLYLYEVTGDDHFLAVGELFLNALKKTKQACGFAAVLDVYSMSFENKMDSFVLAETLKYLFLLFQPSAAELSAARRAAYQEDPSYYPLHLRWHLRQNNSFLFFDVPSSLTSKHHVYPPEVTRSRRASANVVYNTEAHPIPVDLKTQNVMKSCKSYMDRTLLSRNDVRMTSASFSFHRADTYEDLRCPVSESLREMFSDPTCGEEEDDDLLLRKEGEPLLPNHPLERNAAIKMKQQTQQQQRRRTSHYHAFSNEELLSQRRCPVVDYMRDVAPWVHRMFHQSPQQCYEPVEPNILGHRRKTVQSVSNAATNPVPSGGAAGQEQQYAPMEVQVTVPADLLDATSEPFHLLLRVAAPEMDSIIATVHSVTRVSSLSKELLLLTDSLTAVSLRDHDPGSPHAGRTRPNSGAWLWASGALFNDQPVCAVPDLTPDASTGGVHYPPHLLDLPLLELIGDGCLTTLLEKGPVQPSPLLDGVRFAVLVRRGGCTFQEKAIVASSLGASVLLIVNHDESIFTMANVPEDQLHPALQKQRGDAHQLLPTFMVKAQAAAKLLPGGSSCAVSYGTLPSNVVEAFTVALPTWASPENAARGVCRIDVQCFTTSDAQYRTLGIRLITQTTSQQRLVTYLAPQRLVPLLPLVEEFLDTQPTIVAAGGNRLALTSGTPAFPIPPYPELQHWRFVLVRGLFSRPRDGPTKSSQGLSDEAEYCGSAAAIRLGFARCGVEATVVHHQDLQQQQQQQQSQKVDGMVFQDRTEPIPELPFSLQWAATLIWEMPLKQHFELPMQFSAWHWVHPRLSSSAGQRFTVVRIFSMLPTLNARLSSHDSAAKRFVGISRQLHDYLVDTSFSSALDDSELQVERISFGLLHPSAPLPTSYMEILELVEKEGVSDRASSSTSSVRDSVSSSPSRSANSAEAATSNALYWSDLLPCGATPQRAPLATPSSSGEEEEQEAPAADEGEEGKEAQRRRGSARMLSLRCQTSSFEEKPFGPARVLMERRNLYLMEREASFEKVFVR